MHHALCPMRFCLTAMHFALRALPILLIFAMLPGVVFAQGLLQGISGLLEFNFGTVSTKTTGASGETTKTEAMAFNQRVSLNINTDIFPKLRLETGGIFERPVAIFKTESDRTKTTFTRFTPYFYLTLNDPLYTAGIGYNRRQETVKQAGESGFTVINENYLANLGWRPEGLPAIDAQYVRTNTFDEKRSVTDTTKDFISFAPRYEYKGLSLRYYGTYDNLKDKLNDVEVQNLTHNAWVGYSNYFFDKRISLSTTYNFLRAETKVTAGGTTGEVKLQVFPFAGLSALDDTPTDGALDPTPALIDNNVTASAGINIGLPPLGGDFRLRNIGLDFLTPTEVNSLLVWVDRELPPGIASAFPWDIYVSSDNLNWVLVTNLLSAPFGPFQNSFEINFGNVTARYIKVVTRPLSAAVPDSASFPNIFVTEVQAFLKRPVSEVGGEKIIRTSHIYNLDAKARILNIPTLYYNLNYFYNRRDPNGLVTYTISNGFSIDHRFSQIFYGTAKIAREDGRDRDERRVAYIYDASLEAVPLKTLTHRLVFSGRVEEIGGRNSNNNSILLYNVAQLYKGLEVNLNGGIDFGTRETGQKLNTILLNFLATAIPHPTLTLGLDFSYTKTDLSGGGSPSSSTSIQRCDFSISYYPFKTMFLIASIEVTGGTGLKTEVNQSYGLNWSPFPEGALQFRLYYDEGLSNVDNGKSRIFNPSVRWYITKRTYLDVSYELSWVKSSSGKTKSNLFSTSLKIPF